MTRLARPSLDWLLVFIPVSIGADLAGAPAATFVTSALAIVPLAALLGRATEQVAGRLGPRTGGLLNASLGNLTELIVAVLLVNAGQFTIVKASLIGSILGNLLLVLGLSLVAGGSRHKEQRFSAQAADVRSASLMMAVTGLIVPALLVLSVPHVPAARVEVLSGIVALLLIGLYGAALVFVQVTHAHIFETPAEGMAATWSLRRGLAVLGVAALLVGFESELLVSSLEPALHQLGLPAFFVGLVVIPIIGNAAEHASAVYFALRDRVEVTLEIAVGSSTQVAMFVAPLAVFVSLALGRPMDFVFTGFEIATVGLATLIVTLISLDGKTNWLEGTQLLAAYAIIAAAAFFVT